MVRRDEINFHGFLAAMRIGKGVTLEQLCEGLCSVSMMNRIETGDRLPDKLLRDRLVERLGVTNDGFEDYLQPDEYALWKNRHILIQNIQRGELEIATEMISQYEKESRDKNVIEQQFFITMKGQIRQYQGASLEELKEIYGKALQLTVPDISVLDGKKQILSLQEWNLLLEYIHYGGTVGKLEYREERTYREKAYRALLDDIRKAGMDQYANVKILPKIVFFLCMEMMEGEEQDWNCARILQFCNEAIELLRDTGRLFYFCELLEIKDHALAVLMNQLTAQGELQKARALEHTLEETREWYRVIIELYRKYGISEWTENCCYLYQQGENYCIGDVIRIRRKMFGMTAQQLCEGICGEKTLRRLENNSTRTQMAIVRELCKKLGLSPEYQRQRIVTDSYEAIALYEAVRRASSDHQAEKVELLQNRLCQILDGNILINRQELRRLESVNRLELKEITLEKTVAQIKEALEWTVSIEAIQNTKEIYLTSCESNCLHNLATRVNTGEYFYILYRLFLQYLDKDELDIHISMCEMIMDGYASYLGNLGEYAKSNEISDIILLESLRQGRMGLIHNHLYNIWWNMAESKKRGKIILIDFDTKRELQKCIVLSHICKKQSYEKHYLKEFQQIL